MSLKFPVLPEKDFFSMGEICGIAQVPAHTLRYWEVRVGLLRPARRSSGHRRYSRVDLETILLIKELICRRKMTAAGARKAILDYRKKGVSPFKTNTSAESDGAMPVSTLKLLRGVRKEIDDLVRELSR